MHIIRKLQHCEKWKKLRISLDKGILGDIGDVNTSEGRPTGNKKAKAALAAAANSERAATSIETVIADVSKNSNERRAANDARWATLMDKPDKKLELKKTKVASKKRREDFMILTADVSTLDPQAKAACDLLRAGDLPRNGACTTHGGAG